MGNPRVVVIGASFNTGNLGVGALAWSSVKSIKTSWSDAKIILVGTGREPGVAKVKINNLCDEIPTWPVRYCLNISVSNHITTIYSIVLLCRFFPFFKRFILNKSTVSELLSCDLICDITGGDSFSDLYGISRFFRGFLLKRVCQMTGKPFILLPQTYGPFNSVLARVLARNILKNSQTIYSRDREGLAVVQKLIGSSTKIKLCPDVAFVMDAIRPDSTVLDQIDQLKVSGKRLVGLNISGLLYNGGYTRKNMFGLACDYPALVTDIISYFTDPVDQYILLVPHVVPPAFAVENDCEVTKDVLKALPAEIHKKIILIEGVFDQNEIKYFIGLCEFFVGARMHATIAALSQGVPAVGLAYSRKFAGVFESAGVSDCVLDLRLLTNEKIMVGIRAIFTGRDEHRKVLENTVPELKNNLLHMFDDLNGSSEFGKCV